MKYKNLKENISFLRIIKMLHYCVHLFLGNFSHNSFEIFHSTYNIPLAGIQTYSVCISTSNRYFSHCPSVACNYL